MCDGQPESNLDSDRPLYIQGDIIAAKGLLLTLISNHSLKLIKVWDEITYPFQILTAALLKFVFDK